MWWQLLLLDVKDPSIYYIWAAQYFFYLCKKEFIADFLLFFYSVAKISSAKFSWHISKKKSKYKIDLSKHENLLRKRHYKKYESPQPPFFVKFFIATNKDSQRKHWKRSTIRQTSISKAVKVTNTLSNTFLYFSHKKDTNHLSSMQASGLSVCLSVHRHSSVLPVGGFLFGDSFVVVFPLFLMEVLCVNRTLLLVQSRTSFLRYITRGDSIFDDMGTLHVPTNRI